MTGQSTSTTLDKLDAAKKSVSEKYLKPDGNIVGVGIGKKEIGGVSTACIRIYVMQRLREDQIPEAELVRKGTMINDEVPVDVIPFGPFGRNGLSPVKDTGTETRPGSPIRVKTDLPNINEGARGTLGAVVSDGEASYILSCNHILAVNGRVPTNRGKASIVSAEFVGKENEIASRCEFIPLLRGPANSVDCAIAKLNDKNSVQVDFPARTVRLTKAEAIEPKPDKMVTKLGAGTGFTRGKIVDCDVDLYVPYSFMDSVRFDGQIMIEGDGGADFATNGDSGALVVDEESGQPTAMIFGFSGGFAVATPLEKVLTELSKLVKRPLSLVMAESATGGATASVPLSNVKPANYEK